ncbi:BTAD domain-containing putative transcriptional regulator [Streptomyces sp. NPDC058657]|uniref:AfsR/SARP family transcriptional regulator n=1 Tax=unclassified Streptomyces TaxID=2593676 RepID=UPI00364D6C45
MRFGVLGALTVWTRDGNPVAVPGSKVRALLADLLVSPGRPVSVDRLVDDLWGDRELPAHPANTLQGKVSQLRRALEKGEPGAGRRLVRSTAAGYALVLEDAEDWDAGRFDALAAQARAESDARVRAGVFAEALGLWRGAAFEDFVDEPFAAGAIARLEEQRLTAVEDWADASLEAGEHALLVAELGAFVARHPLRERLRSVQLRALYRAGRQSEALKSYAALRERLGDDLGLDPSAELAALHAAILRHDPGLDGPRARRPSRPSPAAPPGGAAQNPAPAFPSDSSPTQSSGAVEIPPGQPRTNLPAPVTALVGRTAAVAEVRELLSTGRILTLTGPGGVGKTRLAVEAARRSRGEFADGVWIVEMTAVDGDLAAVAEMVLRVLGVREEAGISSGHGGREAVTGDGGREGVTGDGGRAAVDRLAGALHGKQLLLVLDNCEHLVPAAAELARRLVSAVPGLRILATSQEPLGLGGEVLFPVPPLELPAAGAGDAAAVRESTAVQLFVARAAGAPGFALDAGNAEAVAELCRRLDGIPLALELAASRVRTLGVHGLLARLDDRLELLAGGYRDAPARQRTLRAMIDWSWGLLTAAERIVLRRLAVHAQGCTLEAAEAVCSGDGVKPVEVLDLLARLVDRSLVVAVDCATGPRYRLLESVRAYCFEQLLEAGEGREVRRRHSTYYIELAVVAAPLLRGDEQRHWLGRLDEESANMRGALAFAVSEGRAVEALRLVDALSWYWVLRSRLTEARRSLASALALPVEGAGAYALRSAGAPPPVAAPLQVDTPLPLPAPDADRLRARAGAWAAGLEILAGGSGDGEACRARVLAALAPWDALDDPAGLAAARWFLGSTLMGFDLSVGEALVDQALNNFRLLNDSWGVAAALSVRTRHALGRSDLVALERDGTESARLFDELGDRWGRLQTVFPLASLAEISGDYVRAAQLHQDGLEMAEELGMWMEASKRLTGLGRIALLSGDHVRARDMHERALKLAADQNFRDGEVSAEIGLALGARRSGDLDAAAGHLRPLLAWFRRLDFGPGLTLVLAELGFVAEQRGDALAALAHHREGLELARGLGDPRARALALEGLAGVRSLQGGHREAARLLGAATAARESVGAPLPPEERGDVDRIAARVRAVLGEAPFEATFAAGAASAERSPVHASDTEPATGQPAPASGQAAPADGPPPPDGGAEEPVGHRRAQADGRAPADDRAPAP